MRNYIQRGQTVPLTAPAGGVESGDVVAVGSLIGVAAHDADAGDPVEVTLAGVFELPKAAESISEGARVYWDSSAGNVTTSASGNTLLGAAIAAAATGDAVVRVRLDGVST